MTHVLVVGNGPAAHRLAENMRDHKGDITLLGTETSPAYNRVLLPSVLDRSLTSEALHLPALHDDVQVHLGATATEIDRDRHLVHTDSNVVHHYDELVLATGAQPRLPELDGLLTADGELTAGATVLRTLSDCERIRSATSVSGRIVVLGGGILGVEAALAMSHGGAKVDLVHSGTHPMHRQLDEAGGGLLADRLREADVTVRLQRSAVAYRQGTVVLDDGERLAAEGLLVCTGVTPNTGLASRAGLAVDNGIVVDDQLRTSDPHIRAIGDCAHHRDASSGFLTTAWDQAETLAQLLSDAESQARYHGTRTITRLRTRTIDLASLGSLDAVHRPDRDVELVTLSDSTRGRYAKVALVDHRIAGAVLFGFPQAIASLGQLHDRDLPVPSDRLGLLLGTAASTLGGSTVVSKNPVICQCNNVTKQALTDAWRSGARKLPELAKATRATTGCGSCTEDVRRLCDSLNAAAPPSTTTDSTPTEQEGAA